MMTTSRTTFYLYTEHRSMPKSLRRQRRRTRVRPRSRVPHTHMEVQATRWSSCRHKIARITKLTKLMPTSRMSIEFETFLVNILHLPTDWRVSLKSDIAVVQKDKEFRIFFGAYLGLCDVVGTGIGKERELYRPHADLCNHVIDVLQGRPNLMVQEGDVIRFDRIDPYVVRGSTANVKPDIMGVLRILFNTPEGISAQEFINTVVDDKDSKSKRKHTDYIPAWPHVLEVKEMKGTDDTIDEGYDAIRLKTKDDKDPLTTRPQKNRTYLKDKANVVDCPVRSLHDIETSQASSRGRKRRAEPGNEQSSSKISRLSKTVSSKGKVASGWQKVLDGEGFALGADRAEKARVQCARYALHILSNAGLEIACACDSD
ncbi:hypothetical protein ARMGADRAFT_228786 [Armillaria gallica]|uniref:Uncharacterized protein n=1 Tax=Armillaria gallica TaxID=47427 RepID=A0A2H3EPS0_ARMGA|nr:hypothetical protein ARMGADRAFT_228786 [Armillaria gallica]